MNFSKIEVWDLAKAWLAISVMFTIAFGRGNIVNGILLSLITAGVAFVVHELAHKGVAQLFGKWSEFRANNQMLIVGIAISFFGVILAAPGGVYTRGASPSLHGKIAFAGPAANIVLALASLALALVPGLRTIAMYSFTINTYLAVFNLIPFPPFDGYSVWQWNKSIWISSIVVAGVLMVL